MMKVGGGSDAAPYFFNENEGDENNKVIGGKKYEIL